jgi:hypothetical protein
MYRERPDKEYPKPVSMYEDLMKVEEAKEV